MLAEKLVKSDTFLQHTTFAKNKKLALSQLYHQNGGSNRDRTCDLYRVRVALIPTELCPQSRINYNRHTHSMSTRLARVCIYAATTLEHQLKKIVQFVCFWLQDVVR